MTPSAHIRSDYNRAVSRHFHLLDMMQKAEREYYNLRHRYEQSSALIKKMDEFIDGFEREKVDVYK